MGPDAMIFIFWMLNLKPTFTLSSLTFIKRLFTSSSLSAIRVVPSAYLRLLIFLSAILILACASSSLAFLMMCSAYKLNKQGDNIQPWCTPLPIWNQSVVPCPVLTVASSLFFFFISWRLITLQYCSGFCHTLTWTVASWPAYRFLRRQIQSSNHRRKKSIRLHLTENLCSSKYFIKNVKRLAKNWKIFATCSTNKSSKFRIYF